MLQEQPGHDKIPMLLFSFSAPFNLFLECRIFKNLLYFILPKTNIAPENGAFQ